MKKLLPWKQTENKWERVAETTGEVVGYVERIKMCYNCYVFKIKPEIKVRDYFISCGAGMTWVDQILLEQGYKEKKDE